MTILDAVILGVVEGLTEFLPVSSTGHLILVSALLGLETDAFLKTFEIAIQSGAILAVLSLFWRKFLEWDTVRLLAIAFVPTGILGLLFYSFIKTYLIGNEIVVVTALALGGVVLILFELLHKEPEGSDVPITVTQAIAIGLFQSIAMIPGVSRSGATILGGLMLGLKRTQIVEFSFLLAVPTMLLATSYDIYKNASLFSYDTTSLLLVGFSTSAIVAAIAMRWLLSFIKTRTFIPFGIYRIVIALLFALVFFI